MASASITGLCRSWTDRRPQVPNGFLALALVVAFGACAPVRPESSSTAVPRYQVFAVRFATLSRFRLRGLISGADSSRRIDAPVMVWALRDPTGRTILFDTGFHRQKFIDQWKPANFVTPDVALRRAGIDPATVADVVLSHIHWDHADGIDLFPSARVWLQRDEFAFYVGPRGEALKPAIDSGVAAKLHRAMQAGHVQLIDGSGVEIFPGVRAFTGGKHTYASQWLSVATADGPIVLASDNAYLYENFERHIPIAQTLDAQSNLRAQQAMLELAGSLNRIVPGHDPAVFERFPAAGTGVARIR